MDPSEILRATLARYESFASYKDRGVIRLWLDGDEKPPVEETFTTLFNRPATLHFRWSNDLGNHEVDVDSSGGWYRPGYPRPPERIENIVEAVAVYALECSSLVMLLCPELRYFWPLGLEDLHIQGKQDVEGAESWCIAGEHPLGRAEQLFVGVSDLLLHKYVTVTNGIRWEQRRIDIEVA